MISLLKGIFAGLFLVCFVVTCARGFWWLYPSVMLVGVAAEFLIRVVTQKHDKK